MNEVSDFCARLTGLGMSSQAALCENLDESDAMAWISDYTARRTYDPENGFELTIESARDFAKYSIKHSGKTIISFYADIRSIETYDPPRLRDGKTYISRFSRDISRDQSIEEYQHSKREIIAEAMRSYQGLWGISTFRNGEPVYADVDVTFLHPSMPPFGE